MGQQFSFSWGFSFLQMGVHSPFFLVVGHSPSAMNAFYSVVKGLAISFAATFKAFGGIPSLPVLFLVLRFCRAVSTSVLFRLSVLETSKKMDLLATRLVASKRLYVNSQDVIVIDRAVHHFESCSLCCHSSWRKTEDLGLSKMTQQ